VGYTIKAPAGDSWKKILVIYNSKPVEVQISLPKGEWQLVSLPGRGYPLYFHKSKTSILAKPISCSILYQE